MLTISSHESKETNCSLEAETLNFISTCVDQNISEIELTKSLPFQRIHKMYFQYQLTKLLPCQRGHEMYLNMCWRKPSHTTEETKYFSTLVDQISSMEYTKRHLNFCWTNPSNARWDTKYISISVDHTYFMRARIQNVPQLLLKKPLPCSEDTKCI